MIQELTVPIHTISEANTREHWTIAHTRHRRQKLAVHHALLSNQVNTHLPVAVTMTRLSPRKLDSDNLQSALKYIRDAISEYFIPGKAPGRADDDPRFTWQCHQEKSPEKAVLLVFHWASLPLAPGSLIEDQQFPQLHHIASSLR